MTHIETIDEVRSGDLQGRSDGAELKGPGAFEVDGRRPPTNRSDMAASAPPMPGQLGPPPRRCSRRNFAVAGGIGYRRDFPPKQSSAANPKPGTMVCRPGPPQ
jgi:hypothetical protein